MEKGTKVIIILLLVAVIHNVTCAFLLLKVTERNKFSKFITTYREETYDAQYDLTTRLSACDGTKDREALINDEATTYTELQNRIIEIYESESKCQMSLLLAKQNRIESMIFDIKHINCSFAGVSNECEELLNSLNIQKDFYASLSEANPEYLEQSKNKINCFGNIKHNLSVESVVSACNNQYQQALVDINKKYNL